MKPQFEQGLLHPNGLGRTSAPQRRQVGRGLAEAIGAGEEGIGAALASDGGFRSMPAVHDGRIRQRKQLALDALQQGVEVAPRQTGPPDRPRSLAGVDDGTLGRRFIDHEVAVLYELAVGYRYDAHG